MFTFTVNKNKVLMSNFNQIVDFSDSFAPFIDILMFNMKYLTAHKLQMHAGTISTLLYLFVSMGDNPHAKSCGLTSQ